MRSSWYSIPTRCLRSLGGYVRILGYMFRLFFSLLRAIWKISRLKHPPASIFGGSRLKPDSIYMQKATELAHMLADAGIPVLTGGGPGIMEAATCGALQTKSGVVTALGITVPGLDLVEPTSSCVSDIIVIQNYAARKWLLIEYSVAYVVFPGGYGTLNELTEVVTLIQTKLHVKVPLVLIGKDYWKPIVSWIHDVALKNDLISKEDAQIFIVTDDIHEAFDMIISHHPHTQGKKHRYPKGR